MRARPRGIQVREIARDRGTLTAARGRLQVGVGEAGVARAQPEAGTIEFGRKRGRRGCRAHQQTTRHDTKEKVIICIFNLNSYLI